MSIYKIDTPQLVQKKLNRFNLRKIEVKVDPLLLPNLFRDLYMETKVNVT